MMKIEQKQTANQAPPEISELFTFDHNHKPVRVVAVNDEPWFVAKDVCRILGITWSGATLKDFPNNEKGCYTITSPNDIRILGGDQKMICVNEPGVYRLIFKSRKPEAERFKAWVFEELLPVLRKTGKYAPGEVENDCPYTNPPVRPDELFSGGKIVKCMMELMNDVCLVDNGDLRIGMATKLMTMYNSM
ncbi:MAG: hypothetical protein LBG17_00115 [Bacteroidales bacterium]|jgi:prophage antirepressor-like protein|nr:hypothetical protein [Bacteroidales bacterium]